MFKLKLASKGVLKVLLCFAVILAASSSFS